MHVATEIQCTKQETNMAHFWSRQKRLAVGFLSNIIIFETVCDSLVRELPVHSCFKVMMGSESCACIYIFSCRSCFKLCAIVALCAWAQGKMNSLGKASDRFKPVLNQVNVCSPNILRTVQRTMICFLIEILVHRTWFGQFDELYFVLNWLVMRCKLRPQLAADAQQTA